MPDGGTGYNESPVVLPSFFGPPGQALQQAIGMKERRGERQQELDLQKQRQQEQDQWKKLNLVQELTDLSKYQTGDDVANATGDKLMSDVYQKYTTNIDKMSPMELQANIQKDMSGIITGMKGMKNELTLADAQMKALKAAYPNIDTGKLYNDYRKDIAGRRLKEDASGFKNEMEVGQPEIKLDDPDFLAQYVKGNESLKDMFANPKGLDDTSVYMGNPNSYTKYTSKIAPWRKPNYDPNALKGGFLPNRKEPALDFKESNVPLGDTQMPVIDKDFYDTIEGQPKLELIKSTKDTFKDYDKFSPQEKEYAQRHMLLKTAKAYDKSGFHPTDIHASSASLLKFYAGGSGSDKKDGETDLRDIYKEVNEATGSGGRVDRDRGFPLNRLSAKAQTILLEYANKITASTGTDALSQADIYVKQDPDGKVYIMNRDNKIIAPIDFTDVNVPGQVSVKEKREVIKQGNEQKNQPTPTKKKDPLGLF